MRKLIGVYFLISNIALPIISQSVFIFLCVLPSNQISKQG